MAAQRLTYYFAYTCAHQGVTSVGGIDLTFDGPLTSAKLNELHQFIADQRSLPVENLIITFFTELTI